MLLLTCQHLFIQLGSPQCCLMSNHGTMRLTWPNWKKLWGMLRWKASFGAHVCYYIKFLPTNVLSFAFASLVRLWHEYIPLFAAKLVPVGYGIKKLQIMMTIVDDLVSVDSLIEDYFYTEPANEYIQSCDIVAFNKICKLFHKYQSPSFYLLALFLLLYWSNRMTSCLILRNRSYIIL